MTAPLPTRRAIRPDSKHYRMARRQRLRRRLPKSNAGKAIFLIMLAMVAGLLIWWFMHHGTH
jgi:hypothetical protein